MRFLLFLVVLVIVAGAVATWLDHSTTADRPHGVAPEPNADRPADRRNPETVPDPSTANRGSEGHRQRASDMDMSQVYFSPRGGGLHAVIAAIDGARQTILMTGSLTGAEAVTTALRHARKRGVTVQVVIASTTGDDATLSNVLYDAGVAVYADAHHQHIDSSYLIIDGALIIDAATLADAAETNDAAAILILHSPALATAYTDNWRVHLAHAHALETVPQSAASATDAPTPPANTSPSSAPPGAADDDTVSPFGTTHRQHEAYPPRQ